MIHLHMSEFIHSACGPLDTYHCPEMWPIRGQQISTAAPAPIQYLTTLLLSHSFGFIYPLTSEVIHSACGPLDTYHCPEMWPIRGHQISTTAPAPILYLSTLLLSSSFGFIYPLSLQMYTFDWLMMHFYPVKFLCTYRL